MLLAATYLLAVAAQSPAPHGHGASTDTAATKREIRALADARSHAVGRTGAAALAVGISPVTVVQYPGLSTVRGPTAVRDAAIRRYGAAGIQLSTQHTVVASDGLFGCAIGRTVIRFAADAAPGQRLGRFVTCWSRASIRAAWRLAVHAQTGEDPGGGELEADLAGPPYSASGRHERDDRYAAVAADRAFARWAVDSGTASAFTHFAAEDAIMLSARPRPRRGPAEISQVFVPAGEITRISWQVDRSSAFGSGGLAATVGTGVVYSTAGQSRTKYLTLWRQGADGAWRFIVDIGSERP